MFRASRHTADAQEETFLNEESGAVLVLWAFFLAIAFGFLALSFDLGRIATTQTQMQSFADQVALAAAGELDGRPDSITRATAAATGLIRDEQTYALDSQSLGSGDFRLAFLSTLPADDEAIDPTSNETSDGREARYVRVDVNQQTVLTPFAHVNAVLTGGSNLSSSIGASATAGFSSFACDITPLFFCVPDSAWRAKNNIGDQIQLRTGNGSFWGPGNFGFLDPTILPVDQEGPCAGLNGAGLYRCLVGAERAVTSCIRTDRPLETEPGQKQGLAGAFNTRFDIFRGAMQSYKTDSNYRPAPNTVQGTLPNAGTGCRGNNPPLSQAMPLPRDTCITTGTCGRFGNGDWDRGGYVTQNHNGLYPAGTDVSSTRYEMYLAEIAAAGSGDILDLDETGIPQCHADGAIADPERRVVVAAAVDCGATPPNGASPVVPVEYVKMFMTEPVGATGSDFDIMVEVVDSAGGTGSGALNGIYQDFIQLYR